MLGSNMSSKQTAHPGNNQTCTVTQYLHNRRVRLLKSNYRDCTKLFSKFNQRKGGHKKLKLQ